MVFLMLHCSRGQSAEGPEWQASPSQATLAPGASVILQLTMQSHPSQHFGNDSFRNTLRVGKSQQTSFSPFSAVKRLLASLLSYSLAHFLCVVVTHCNYACVLFVLRGEVQVPPTCIPLCRWKTSVALVSCP